MPSAGHSIFAADESPAICRRFEVAQALLVRDVELRSAARAGSTSGSCSATGPAACRHRRDDVGRARAVPAGEVVHVTAAPSIRASGRSSRCSGCGPPPRRVRPDELMTARRARRADGGRPARAHRDGPEPAPAAAARGGVRRGVATWASYRDAPAAKRYHQAYRHGLLEHSLTVAQAVGAISATFPGIDRDVAVTGALLHDIGKLEAYEVAGRRDRHVRPRTAVRRDPARLLPRPPRDRAPRRLPAELAQAVLHIILSHHGSLEHGSPVVPCTREATLVHMIDNLGGRLGSFDRLEKELPDGRAAGRATTGRSAAAPTSPRAPTSASASRLARCASRARPAPLACQICANSAPTVARARARARPDYSCSADGQGHGEADPPAVADLLPDGRAAPGDRAGDPARRRGLQRDERGRVRAPLLRRPLRARGARDRAARSRSRSTGWSSRRPTRCRPRTSTCRRSSSPTRSWPRCSTALHLLDGEFAYAEPLRLALQQISWGRPSPLNAPEQHTVALGITGSAGGHEVSQRLAKIETAIFRRKTIVFDYYTMERDEVGTRRVDPYQLLYQGGQFYLVGRSHERDAIRVFRLSRIRGKVGYATKAEHDFQRPADFDPRAYANRIDWQFGEPIGDGRGLDRAADRLADRAPLRPLRRDAAPRRTTASRVLHHAVRERAPADRVGARPRRERAHPRAARAGRRAARAGRVAHRAPHRRARPWRSPPQPVRAAPAPARARAASEHGNGHHPDAAIRPERFARLVTLASILIDAGRAGRRLDARRAVPCAQALRAGAARGHLGAQRRQLRRRHLRPLCRDPRRRDDRGRSRALRRLVRPPGPAAAGRGQGADRRHRPDRRAHP